MKKLLFFITLMFSPMLASAQTVSDVQNSGCMANARGVESEESVPTIILKKEGTILSVELQNYISNCATYDFEIKSSISDGIDGSPCSLSVNVNSVLPKIITTCDCPFNVSFTIRDFEPNSFYLDCWWYKGLVELTEGEPLVLEDVYEDATIDGMNFTLQKAFHQAMVTRSEWVGEVRIPSELSHEGQTYSVTSISSDAFTDNTTMTKVFIPRTIKNMNFSEESGFNRNLFSWCSALESIEVEEGNPVLCSVGGVLFNKEKTRLYTYPAADSRTSYTVPEGVTWIDGSAFASNHHLVSISLPDGVTSLGSSAFYDCTSLEEVNLPYGLKSLAGYLFWNCSSLTDIQIPKSVTSVMSNAFKGCKALKTLDLPESVTFLGDYVFSGCKLDSLIIRGVIDFSWNVHYWLFDGMGTETKVYVHPTQVDKFKAIYKGPVYPLSEESQEYFPEGTKWTEIRLDTLKYDSWYSKVGDEWVPNFETIEYHVKGEYTAKNGDKFKCVYTSGPEWTDSLTLGIQEGELIQYNEDDEIIVTAFGRYDDGAYGPYGWAPTYQFDWSIGKGIYFKNLLMSMTTYLVQYECYYGIIDEIKEDYFGGVRQLKYVDLNGKAPECGKYDNPQKVDTQGGRIIQGIGITEWNDGECLFGPPNPYFASTGEGGKRHYRSMLVHFERNGEVLYDVWPEKVQIDYYYYKGNKIPLTLNENKVIVSIPKEYDGTSKRIRANVPVLRTIKDELFDIFIIPRSDFEKLTSQSFWEEDAKSVVLTSSYYSENNKEVFETPYLTVKLKEEGDANLLDYYAEKYRLKNLGSFSQYLPLWYVLYVTPDSEKSPLQCANEIFESGEFAASVPDLASDDYGIRPPYRPFIEDGKVWKVGTSTTISDNSVQIVDYYYFDGDTIIDGKTCKQMWCQRFVSPDSPDYSTLTQTPSLSKVGAWYEEDKKVYVCREGTQGMEMLYDFSLEANDTLILNDYQPYYIVGPKQIGGLKGFKGIYRDIMLCGQDIYITTWLEGVGGIDGPLRNVYPETGSDPQFLMSCTVGDEVIYLNDEYEDGTIPGGIEAAKKRFDFTHTTKLQPKNPRRGEEELSLYGEYNNLQLGIHLDPLDDAYQVSITNESGEAVYEKTVNAGAIVGLSIDISAYAKGRYTVTVENSNEVFTGEFETETTGIEIIYNKVKTRTEIYNLQGQRLSSLQKGLNIVNGQKVYVK